MGGQAGWWQMSKSFPVLALPSPPPEIDKEYMNRLVRTLEQIIVQLVTSGDERCQSMIINAMPTSAVDQPPGMLWNDDGTVRIVMAGDTGLLGVQSSGAVGTIAVTT